MPTHTWASAGARRDGADALTWGRARMREGQEARAWMQRKVGAPMMSPLAARYASIPFDATCYDVAIRTGERRGAGTPCGAEVEFFGVDGRESSGTHRIREGKGFGTAGNDLFQVWSARDLGDRPARLRLRRLDAGASDVGAGWFVNDVVIKRRGGRSAARFAIRGWLGESDSGGVKGSPERWLSAEPFDDADPLAVAALKPPSEYDSAIDGKPVRTFAGAAVLPHPDKVQGGAKASIARTFGHGGEDAFFISRTGTNGCATALGVADGVYGWRNQGIDAGEYSRGLMRAALNLAESKDPPPDALQLVTAAHNGANELGLKGSSTICIVSIDIASGTVTSANLGDSGFVVLRPEKGEAGADLSVLYRSVHMEHEFGRPYQLGHHEHSDTPADCHVETACVRPGDVLVLGSDGLFDNLSDEEIAAIVAKASATSGAGGRGAWNHAIASATARTLVGAAFEQSISKTADTPYSRGATEFFNLVFAGGKRDDICAIVALVEEEA